MSAPRSEGAKPTGRCRHCGRHTYGGATSCKSRRCPGYAPLWAGDQRRKLFDNLNAYEDGDGLVHMGALTAPGKDVLPFDPRFCDHPPGVKCSGKIGCRVVPALAEEWNRTAPRRWRDLHRRAYVETTRHLARTGRALSPVAAPQAGGACGAGAEGSGVRRRRGALQAPRKGPRPLHMLGRVWEMQARGVLHVHPVLAYGTARQKYAVRFYLATLERLASGYGFGFQSRQIKPQPAKNAAAYLSSYFVTGPRSKMALQESVQHHRMPRSIIHVSCELTQRTGITMRELRLRRYCWVVARRSSVDLAAARTIIALVHAEKNGTDLPGEVEMAHLAQALARAGRADAPA